MSLWKGRKTNRPRNKSAPVLREIVRAVFAAQVVLAADFTTEIRLPYDLRSLTLTKSTLFAHLNPAKEACTPPMAPAFLLTDRRGPKDAAQAAILLKKCVERSTRTRRKNYLSPQKARNIWQHRSCGSAHELSAFAASAGYGGREESGKCNYMSNSIPGVSTGILILLLVKYPAQTPTLSLLPTVSPGLGRKSPRARPHARPTFHRVGWKH